ncbi:MAG TPA: glycosyltransferase family 4 protein [Candidatus Thermoplasmatota archaeon]|nr:glycosyltransferase family 4 protein [Candidatus Thermoplasmatota archaeon]
MQDGPRRIVVATSFTWPKTAGLERVVENEVRELARRGYDVHVVCSRSPHDPAKWLPGVDVKVHRVPFRYLGFVPGVVYGLFYAFSAARTLRRLARREDAVVHAHNTFAAIACMMAGLRRKTALHVHSISSQDNLAMESTNVPWPVRVMHRLDDALNLVVELFVYNVVPLVLPVSDRELVDCKAKMRHPERCVMVRNGIDTDFFRPDPEARAAFRKAHGIREDEVVVMFLGRFNPKNGTMTIAQAVPHANRMGAAHARFVFVGEGTEEAEMRRVTAGEPNVLFVPAMPSHLAFPAADVFASHLSNVAHGTGLTVQEAMATGVATVSGSDPYKDVLYANWKDMALVRKEDPVALAEAFVRLVNDRALREALGRQGREKILREYSVRAQVDAVLAHLTRVWRG